LNTAFKYTFLHTYKPLKILQTPALVAIKSKNVLLFIINTHKPDSQTPEFFNLTDAA
jgi:hypothetical protein